jgi:hypothetical protein
MRRTPLVACLAVTVLATLGPVAAARADQVQPDRSTTRTAVNNANTALLDDDYWTPQRIAAAKPLDAPAPSRITSRTAAVASGARKSVPATPPSDQSGLQAAASEWVTVGRLVFHVKDKGDFICTANVVSANNHDVIATARHCVMDIGTGQTYESFRFAPSYNRGTAPYGWWNWRSMGWRVDDSGAGGDNAFIVLATGGNSNRHVQDVVGGSGIGFNWPTNNYAYAIGIPGDKDYAVWCQGQPYDGPGAGVQIPNCIGLTGGASGAPYVVNYQSDGSAVQTASFMGSWGDSYFAYYRDAAWQIYNGAQNA